MEKKEISVKEKDRLGLCDILLGIFKNFKGNYFLNDRSLIHYTFYELREKYSILSNLVFKKDVIFPESRMLDEAFYSLQPEFLGKINPALGYFQIKKDRINLLWEKHLKNKLKNVESDLKDIAKVLEKELGVKEIHKNTL